MTIYLIKSFTTLYLMQLQTEVDNENTAGMFESKFCIPLKGAADFIHVISP
jgi:hypothetical protein